MLSTANQDKTRRKLKTKQPVLIDKAVVADDLPQKVIDGLYIGSIHSAFNESALELAGVTHIVNATGLPATFPHLFTYMTIELRDKKSSNIFSCIPSTVAFIEDALKSAKGGGVLVHCSFGRSRSAALIVAYLMMKHRYSYADALSLVKQRRNVVNINQGFEEQLQTLELCDLDVHKAHARVLRSRFQKFYLDATTTEATRVHSEAPSPDSAEERDGKMPSTSPTCNVPLVRHEPARMTHLCVGTHISNQLIPLRAMDMQFVCGECLDPLFCSGDILVDSSIAEQDPEPEVEDEPFTAGAACNGLKAPRAQNLERASSGNCMEVEPCVGGSQQLKRRSSSGSCENIGESSEGGVSSHTSLTSVPKSVQEELASHLIRGQEWKRSVKYFLSNSQVLPETLNALSAKDQSAVKCMLSKSFVELPSPLFDRLPIQGDVLRAHCPSCQVDLGARKLQSVEIDLSMVKVIPFPAIDSIVVQRKNLVAKKFDRRRLDSAA